MASNSSKALPFLVLLIAVGALGYEAYSGEPLDLEAYVPILTAIGIGGAAKSAITKAAAVKKIMPAEIKAELEKIVKNNTTQSR